MQVVYNISLNYCSFTLKDANIEYLNNANIVKRQEYK